MKKFNRFLSALLTLCMVFSAVAVIFIDSEPHIHADDETETITSTPETGEDISKEFTASSIRKVKYKTAEEKLATMKLYLTTDYGYELYALELTGEIAIRNSNTGEIIFSNPYDANQYVTSDPTSSSTPTAFESIVSQLIVDYTDQKGASKQMCSFTSAAENNQISISYVKNGISVSYAIGRADSRRLCPMTVTTTFFEESVLAKIEDANDRARLFPQLYQKYDLFDESQNYPQSYIENVQKLYPITKKIAIYAINDGATNVEKNRVESILKAWCPEITYETIEEQHTITEYEAKAAILPCFRMTLIYRLNENGLEISLPANSITFNEDYYTLKSITVLPYFGAGNGKENNGFTFFPDGSGSIVEFKDVSTSSVILSGTLYGADYAYHTLPTSFTGRNEQMRFPVFGIVDEKEIKTKYFLDEDGKVTDIEYCEHKYETVVTEPTCTEGGYTTYTCTLCDSNTPGHTVVKDYTDPAHKYDPEVEGSIVIDPTTCVHLGYTIYKCVTCEKVTRVDDEVLAEHKYVGSPIDGRPGITVFTCSVCNHQYETGHNDHNLSKIASISSTCISGWYENLRGDTYFYENGILTFFVADSDILKFEQGKQVKLPDGSVGTVKLASYIKTHKDTINNIVSSKDNSAYGIGNTEYNRFKVEIEVDIPDFSAVYANESGKNIIRYSVEKKPLQGYSLYFCSECGYYEKKDYAYDNHAYKTDSTRTVAANCQTETDAVTIQVCQDCGAERKIVTPFEHKWEDKYTSKTQNWVTTTGKVVESGNILAKYQLYLYKCKNCDATIEKIESCPKDLTGQLVHLWEDIEVTVEGDCTHLKKVRQICKLCKTTRIFTNSNYSHKEESTVVEPTCTERGYTIYNCTVCGQTRIGAYVEPQHDYEEIVTDYTCTTPGYTTFVCRVCGDTYIGNHTEAAHRFEETERIEPSCGEHKNGQSFQKCTLCGETKVDEIEWQHDWSKTIIVETATETTDGLRYSFCKVCFEEKSEAIPAFGTGGLNYVEVTTIKPYGFVAVLTEGESFVTITTYHGGSLHPYSATYITLNPRPSDEYNLADSLSVGTDAKWVVTSDRRYTGNYTMKIYMLSDSENSKYSADIAGMAAAYRDHLINNGTLTKLENTSDDIPLYIEALGSTTVQTTVLSFPVYKNAALTTFDDLKMMSQDLAKFGITNVNYRLTGFTDGGLDPTVPNKVSFESVVGGNKGYKDFAEYASKNGIGVFTDFDYAYSHNDKLFDGFNVATDALKTIDGRYIIKKEYSPTFQMFSAVGLLGVSPSVFGKFYSKLAPDLTKLGYNGISVSTLGTDLNSDFDTDEPYNREDSKKFITALLSKMKADSGNNVMIDGGNAYAYPYVKHILNTTLTSSNFLSTSASVPFLGMTLHGYINYTGTPTNEASNIRYEILKMIESGANPYFILCVNNSEVLKEDKTLNEYFSIAYDIWMKNDNTVSENNIVDIYNKINDAIKDVQYETYKDFRYLIGERVIGESERAEYDAKNQEKLDKLYKEYTEAQKAFDAAQELYKRLYKEGKADAAEVYYDNIATRRTVRNDARTAYLDFKTSMEAKTGYNEDGEYNFTELTVNDESIAYVEYTGEHGYILNYNNFDVVVDLDGVLYTVSAMDYCKVTK